ncbi:hypothetical protein BSKO_05113 [Bryopsis sp. KO-2023]|nr:hypothetical protein BSKO_05113 [Bryopsis sp. KO-2023]
MENMPDFTEVSVVAIKPMKGAGRMLNKKDESEDVFAGDVLSIPLYLAEELIEIGAVRLGNLPKGLDARSRRLIRADPSVVNLPSLCPYFYEVGYRIAKLIEDSDLVKFLETVWQHRWENLIPKVSVADGVIALEMEDRLDMEERRFVKLMRNSRSGGSNFSSGKITSWTSR